MELSYFVVSLKCVLQKAGKAMLALKRMALLSKNESSATLSSAGKGEMLFVLSSS